MTSSCPSYKRTRRAARNSGNRSPVDWKDFLARSTAKHRLPGKSRRSINRIGRTRIEIGKPVVFLAISYAQLPSQTQVDRQLACRLPVILDVCGVVKSLSRDRIDCVDAAGCRIAEKKRRRPNPLVVLDCTAFGPWV